MIKKGTLILVMLFVCLLSLFSLNVFAEDKTVVTAWGGAFLMRAIKDTTSQEEFNQRFPDIEVKTTGYPYDDYARKMRIALGAGESTPDILVIHSRWASEFMKSGMLLNLTNKINPIKDNFLGDALDITVEQGKSWGLPLEAPSVVFFYRKDIFDSMGLVPPKDFDEYLEVGKKLREKGLYMDVLDFSNPDPNHFRHLLSQLNGNIFDKESNVILDTPEGKGILTAKILKRKVDSGVILNLSSEAEQSTAYQQNKVVASYNGTSFSNYLNAWFKPGDQGYGNWRMVPAPTFEDNGAHSGYHTLTFLFINKYSQNPEAAWKVINYLANSTSGALRLTDVWGLPTAQKDAYKKLSEGSNSNEVFGNQEVFSDYAKFMLKENPGILNIHPSFAEAQEKIVAAMVSVYSNEKTPEEAIKEVSKEIKALKMWY